MLKPLLPFVFMLLYGVHPTPECGGTLRWDNKILVDPKGLSLFSKTPKPSTIHTVVGYTRPPIEQLRTNRGAIESKKVTVTTWLIGLGEEDNDQDYHLILCSLNFKDSMIAEIPDPTCTKLENFIGLRQRYTAARDFITTEIDATPGDIHYLPAPVKVKVTGFLFFDRMAHGNGHARNGIEIHPVLKIWGVN